jgi:hypothetical protein
MAILDVLKNVISPNIAKIGLYMLIIFVCVFIGSFSSFLYWNNQHQKDIETVAIASLYGYWNISGNSYCLIDENSLTYITIKSDGLNIDSVHKITSFKPHKKSTLDGQYSFDITLDKKVDYLETNTFTMDLNYVLGELVIIIDGKVVDTMTKDSEMSIKHHSA